MTATITEPIQKTSFDDVKTRKQKTLNQSVSLSGMGLFTGENATLEIHPAEPNSGIVFRRVDLPGKPQLLAEITNVVSTPRCTILGTKDFTIRTVEHVLAALRGLSIDNALLELAGPEVPILDGSSQPFVELMEEVGFSVQDADRPVLTLQAPVSWSKDDIHLIALPSDEYRISYTMHFPRSVILYSQYRSMPITEELFSREIASSRTFCFYEEIAPLIEKGMIKGGTPDNAVIIQNDQVVNPDGLRFPDEMVRHKILDLVGDLSLLPFSFNAHVIAIRSGHASNVAFARELLKHFKKENA